MFVLSDIAYAEIYFDGKPPPSVLQVEGAKDIAVEVNSLSKTYSMAGWRMGFAVGNERLIAALARVKSYLDYGAFTPIQVAAAAALNGPQECVAEMRQIYKNRRDVLVEASRAPAGTCRRRPRPCSPGRRSGADARAGLAGILQAADGEGGVAVSPGAGFGEYGEGYIRIALVENEQRIRQAARNVKKFLSEAATTMHNVIPLASGQSR